MWSWLKSLIDKVWSFFSSFMKELTKILFDAGAGYILDVARQAVAEMATTDLTSEQKRIEAFNKIKEYAISKGLTVKDSVINSVIELAYQEWQNANQ